MGSGSAGAEVVPGLSALRPEDRPHTPEEAPVRQRNGLAPFGGPHHCTGCTACASGCPKAAITMERDREGFAYPVIDGAACVRCGHCTAVCPSCGAASELHARCIRGLE
ncbi:MAG: NADH-quinone oxidoreductase subunit I [Dysosmobacter welbionis]